jgi:hypothetical protein
MAAPTPTARGTPGGRLMPEGFKSKVTLGRFPTISLYERDVKPPAIDGGEPINTTTQFNTRRRTFSPTALIQGSPCTAACGYDPDAISVILAALNAPDTITVLFPDGSTYCFYGWLQKFEPTDLKEKEFPIANITFFESDYDYVNFVEAGPVFTAAAGT